MEIVKKNILSILCGVVAIICFALVFYPFNGLYKGLHTQVEARKSVGDQLQRVKNEPRSWPTLSPREEDHIPLKHFPTQNTLDTGTKMTQSWTQDSTDFLNHAIEFQAKLRQAMLVPGSLPGVPGQQSLAYNFLDEYKKIIGVPSTPGGPPVLPTGGALGVLPGGLPPSDVEISDAIAAQVANIQATVPKVIDGKIQNQEEIDKAVRDTQTLTAEKLRYDKAVSYVVYLDPVQSFQPEPRINTNATVAPGLDDIFFAQVGLWVQQEFCRAVGETNSNAKKGILDAPIKRLITLRLTLPYVALPLPPGQPPADPTANTWPLPSAHVAHDFSKFGLGHVSNELYDVIPVQLSIVCEADTLPATLTGLVRDRFIMIRNVDIQSVDSAVAYAQGFVYGDKPVVQVNMRCQYLMLRKFLGPLMPQDIVRGLAAPVPAS